MSFMVCFKAIKVQLLETSIVLYLRIMYVLVQLINLWIIARKMILTRTKLLILLFMLDDTHPIVSDDMLPEDTVQTKGLLGSFETCRIL